MSTGTLRGAILLDRLPQQILVDRAEYFVRKLEGPNFGAAQIVNINSCHLRFLISLFWPRAWQPSMDQPSRLRQIRGALAEVSLLW